MSFPIKVSTFTKGVALAATGVLLSAATAQAANFTAIRIGDVDGFGYGDGGEYKAANGDSVNVDGSGFLGNGDFLPDLNGNEIFATYNGDDFNHQTEAESGGNSVTGSGFTDKGSSGSQFTDLSLSTSSLDDYYGITPLKDKRNSLRTQRNGFQADINGLNEQLAENKLQLEPLWAQRKSLVEQRKPSQDSITAINAEIKTLRDSGLAWNSDEVKALRAEREPLAAERDGFNAQIADIDQSIAPLTAIRDGLNAERTPLVEQRNSLNSSITGLNADIAKMEAEFLPQDSKIPQAEFVFDFAVEKGKVVEDSPFYLNLLFADYDVKDAEIQFTTSTGSFTKELTRQRNSQGYDGWIQSAFVELDFEDIFSAAGDNFDGYLKAEVIAPDEPYLAFDFVELSASKIDIEVEDPTDVPEPTTALGLLMMGAFGARSLKKRQQA